MNSSKIALMVGVVKLKSMFIDKKGVLDYLLIFFLLKNKVLSSIMSNDFQYIYNMVNSTKGIDGRKFSIIISYLISFFPLRNNQEYFWVK